MKVLFIHEHGRTHGGGAVTALHRLHSRLPKFGVESVLACRRRPPDAPANVVELPRSDWFEHYLGMISWRIGLNDVHCVSSFKIKKSQPFLDADVVNIHGWHTNYFNYLALPGLAARKPVIGTMHDMWNITGHCAVAYDCQRWKTGCGKCPYPDTFPPIGRDATALEWKLKDRVYRKSNITFVAPSRWLLDLSRQGLLKNHDLRQIPNPVDETIYLPLDKNTCRTKLGLPHDKHVIMFVSVAIKNRLKGGDLLLGALQQLPERIRSNSVLLLLGAGGEEIAKASGMRSLQTGYVHDDAQKAILYSAADVLVQPSRAENQSLVILEAMSCGTPVATYATGGMPELVNSGPAGIVAPAESVNDLSSAIATILENHSAAEDYGRGGRQAVLERYTLDQHCRSYIALFEEKINQWRANSSADSASDRQSS